jgi:hypothetical protein
MEYLSTFQCYDVLQVWRPLYPDAPSQWLDFATLRTTEEAVQAVRIVDSCGQSMNDAAPPAEYRIVSMQYVAKYPLPTVTLTFDVPQQVLKDLLTSAVEGGSNYWLCARDIIRDAQGDVISIIEPADAEQGTRKLLHFPADHFKPGCEDGDIGLGAIARGLRLVLNGALPKRLDLIANVARIPSDGHDFDAADADVILQLGFFGEVIFG